jgi:hypothetical protein
MKEYSFLYIERVMNEAMLIEYETEFYDSSYKHNVYDVWIKNAIPGERYTWICSEIR